MLPSCFIFNTSSQCTPYSTNRQPWPICHFHLIPSCSSKRCVRYSVCAELHVVPFLLNKGKVCFVFLTRFHENYLFLLFFFSNRLLPQHHRNHSIYCEWQVREWQRRINRWTFGSHSVPLTFHPLHQEVKSKPHYQIFQQSGINWSMFFFF